MKKTLIVGLVLATVSMIRASTVSWGIQNGGSGYTDFGTDFLDDSATTVNIVYLGAGTVEGSTFDEILKGTIAGDPFHTDFGSIPYGSTISVDTTQTGNYAAFLTTVVDGKTWYNVSEDMGTLTSTQITALFSEGTAIPDGAFAFSSTKNDSGATPAIGGGWYTIPEPGIACMALLGIGMMIKRRRA